MAQASGEHIPGLRKAPGTLCLMTKRRREAVFRAGQGREADELDAVNARVRNKRNAAQAIRRSMEAQIEQRAKSRRTAEAAAASKAKLR